jgi:hypothetical protein
VPRVGVLGPLHAALLARVLFRTSKPDDQRVLADLRERLAKFDLNLPDNKTRLRMRFTVRGARVGWRYWSVITPWYVPVVTPVDGGALAVP